MGTWTRIGHIIRLICAELESVNGSFFIVAFERYIDYGRWKSIDRRSYKMSRVYFRDSQKR